MFSTHPFSSILELLQAFPTEQSCIDHLEFLRWGGDVKSPFDPTSKVYKCKDNKYKCKNTGKYFNVATKTIFENSKIPLLQWFMAIYLFTSHKKGISSYQLAEDLNITQKTAWFMLQRIRYAAEHESFLQVLEGVIEVDETFVGGKNKNRHRDKKVKNSQGRSFKDKTPVFGAIQREVYEILLRPSKIDPSKMVKEKMVLSPSRLIGIAVKDTKAESIQPLIYRHIKSGSTVMSDEWHAYKGIGKHYNHQFVDHGKGQYVDGDVTTNRMENFWSHFKRTIIGTYHSTSRKHLQLYVNESVFRFNFKANKTDERFNLFLQSVNNKRITYKSLTAE